jgi:hypothetical protein
MSASIADTIEGATLRQEDDGKISLTRTFIVTGLSGTASQRLYEALSVTGIPAYRAAHPTVSGLVCASREAVAIDHEQARVVCTYKTLTIQLATPSDTGDCQMTVGGSVQSQDTNLDYAGDVIKVYYNTTADGTPVTVSVMKPQCSVRYSRLEPAAPYAKSMQYQGKTNSDTFLGEAAGTWLCTRLEGTSTDGGESFQVEYEFQFNPNGWDATVIWTDPETGNPPYDVDDAVNHPHAMKTVQMYTQIAFSGLNL